VIYSPEESDIQQCIAEKMKKKAFIGILIFLIKFD